MNRKKISDFVRYDNTLPLFLIIIFIGTTSTFALSNPTVQDALLQPTTKVVSIDNSYIANVDLSNYSPKVTITGVLEDTDSYSVTYSFETIELVDGVWKPTTISRDLKVDKSVLGKYKDLGLFVTEELKQVIDQEKLRLIATQEIERKNLTQKVVATQYNGLIGKLLDEKTETIPGYVPVVTEQPPISVTETPVPATSTATTSTPTTADNSTVTQTTTTTDTTTTSNVNVQIVGATPESVSVGATYTDKGVFVNNAVQTQINTKINGTPVGAIVIDTSKPATFVISYEVITDKGTYTVERTVNVVEATPAPETTTSEPVTTTTPEPVIDSATTAPADPAPAPTPDPVPTE